MVLFDGVCNLCNASVRFVIERDSRAQFRFASLQSNAAARLLAGFRDRGQLPDSIVLIEDGQIYTRSEAALRIARRLSFPWPLAYGGIIVPRAVRDAVYDFVAGRRYRWFGRRDVCMVPSPEMRQRFLDD